MLDLKVEDTVSRKKKGIYCSLSQWVTFSVTNLNVELEQKLIITLIMLVHRCLKIIICFFLFGPTYTFLMARGSVALQKNLPTSCLY